ncbi:hypothetical protein ACWGS9_10870 [Bradyrhizobium sp. Arg314]
MSSLAVLPALLGMWQGQMLRQTIGPAILRRWFLIFLILLAKFPDTGILKGCRLSWYKIFRSFP